MDDTEALDWGNEEEERGMDYDERRESAAEDAEDAVSLGGDEEDEFLTYQSRLQQGANQGGQTPPRPAHHAEKLDTAEQEPVARGRRSERQRSSTPHKSRWDSQSASEQSPMLKRAQSFGKLTHALPPKPVVSSVPFVHPSHPSIIEATAMATRLDHEKRGNGVITKSHSHEGADALPPDWEMKHPKSGRGVYYYNSRTQVSTWTRPANTTPSLSVREKDKDRPQPIELHAPEERRDKVLSTKSAEPVISSRSGRTDTDKDLSYDDRHYRPGESGSRDERPTPQVHVRQVDSYQPPRSPSPPPRHREDDRSQLNRRPPSPVGSFGDRDRARSSRRDNPRASSPISLADRYWVPSQEPAPADRPIVPRERERKRDTEEPLPSAERERRNLPRDADRSSTLRPRSPSIPMRDSQHSTTHLASTMLAPSAPARAPSGTSAAPRQKSRFSQAAPPVESEQQAPDERKPKESNSRPAESAADSPSSRRRPTDRERERDVVRDTLKIVPADRPPAQEDRSVSPFQSPAADSQRQRKRLPLPSQSAIFREGSRQAPARPDAGYPAFPPAAGPRDSTFPSKPAANDPSIPSGPRISPLVPPRDSPDRHWPSRVPPSGPAASSTSRARMDSYVPNEPVTSRDRDVMDTDELPSATASSKSFEPPSRPSATNYIGAEDQVDSLPKGPRAMAGRNIPPDAPPAGGNMESTSHPNLERSRSARNERESRPSILPQEDRGRHYERTISPLEDPPYRPRAPPDSSRAQGNWDPPPREQGRRQWDHSRRSPGAKPSNLKVSGANGTPIGDRSNRFASASESPHPPKALMTPIDSRIQPPPGGPGDASGARAPRQSNGLKESYERPPHLDASLGTRRHSFAAAGPPAGLHRQPVDRIVSPTLPRRPVSPGVGIQNGPASRQTRSGPTHSRFGPPVQRQEPERLYIPRNPSPESLRSAPRYPEEHSHSGVPSPPMSRDSSMASVWDPPAHHPPRPARSPVRRPESPRHRGAEVYPPPRRDEYEGARRYEERHRDSDRARVPPAPRPTSHRYDSDDVKAHPHSMPSPAPSRPYPAEPARQSFLDARGDHYVARDERGVGAEHTRPPRREASPVRKVHPERELLLQSSYAPYPRSEHEGDRRAPRHSEGVSPLPLPPASYGRPEIVDRAYDVGRRPHDHRLEERYRDVDGGMARGDHRGRGTSLLDRLSLDESPSLRDRVQLPAKRDRDEMDGDGDEEGGAMDVDGEDFDGSKRSRRRGAVKPRRARRVM